MAYREKLEQYKKGQLAETEAKVIAADIDRQDAIGEYLADQLEVELNPFSGGDAQDYKAAGASADQRAVDFEEQVKRYIKRTFYKIGTVIGAVVLVVILFIQFALSPLVSMWYYNPAKMLDANTNQLQLDMAVYTELSSPGKRRGSISVTKEKFGNYDLSIHQVLSYDGQFENITGVIQRGRLRFDNPYQMYTPAPDVFGCINLDWNAAKSYAEQEKEKQKQEYSWAGGLFAEEQERIDQLADDQHYLAYVTLQHDLGFDAMYQLLESYEQNSKIGLNECWLGVRSAANNDFALGLIGYAYDDTGNVVSGWDREQYPELMWGVEDDDYASWEMDEKFADDEMAYKHLTSMLKYMSQQKQFLAMTKGAFQDDPQRYSQALSYIEEHGLSYYGFACVVDKEGLQELSRQDEVLCVYTDIY